MQLRDAAFLMSWAVTVVLALAVAAMARVLRFHEARLQSVTFDPRRLEPGDRLRWPRSMSTSVQSRTLTLLLFTKADCGSCRQAATQLNSLVDSSSGIGAAVLWKAQAPASYSPAASIQVLDHQAPAFRELQIGLMPFAVLVRDQIVVASGAVGSPERLDEIWAAATSLSSSESHNDGYALNLRGEGHGI